MRKVAWTVADLLVLTLGAAALVYVALELPGEIEYVALLTLVGLGLVTVGVVELGERWTPWRPKRHHLLGTASLFGGLGGLALTELVRADHMGEVILHALGVLILIPFALVVLFGWFRLGKHS
jgi:hypothetical protein